MFFCYCSCLSSISENFCSESIKVLSFIYKSVSNWYVRNGIKCFIRCMVGVYEEIFFIMVFGCLCYYFFYCNVEESSGDVKVCCGVYNSICSIRVSSGSLC